jgi:hypothetical protein
MSDMFASFSDNDNFRKRAKGAFPRLSLSKVLELPRAIFELGEGEPVRRLTVFNHLGKSPDSGSSRLMVTASNGGYGLTRGGYQADYLELSDLGLRIINPDTEYDKYKAVYESLMLNDLFKGFMDRFQGKSLPPNDEIPIDFLRNSFQLSFPDGETLWSVIKDNLSDFGLIKELSGRRTIVSPEMALEAIDSTPHIHRAKQHDQEEVKSPIQTIEATQSGIDNHNQKMRMPLSLGETNPQFHFNIQIHLPSDASPEAYDAIFRSLSVHLLGRESEDR